MAGLRIFAFFFVELCLRDNASIQEPLEVDELRVAPAPADTQPLVAESPPPSSISLPLRTGMRSPGS